MKSRIIETPGGRTSIQVFEGGSGPDLLFLHGAGGILPGDPFLEALSRQFTVHAPLLPGYGDSSGEENLRDMLDFTLHTHDVMGVLGLERPLLVGHSMGGMIAAELAAVIPDCVDRLVLIAPAGLWDDAMPVADLFAMLPREMPHWLFHDVEAGTKLMTAGLRLDDPAFLQDFLVMNARRFGTAGKILFPIPDRGLRDRLYRIRARTTIIWGKSDRLIPAAYGKAFAAAIPGSALITVPEAGHMLTLERPDLVVRAITDGLKVVA